MKSAMTMTGTSHLAAFLLCLAPALTWSDGLLGSDGRDRATVRQTVPVLANATVEVSNAAGSIEVVAWDKHEIGVTAELDERAHALQVTGDATRPRVEIVQRKSAEAPERARLQLQVPGSVRLEIEAETANISVSGVGGAIRARNVNGDITLNVDATTIQAQTVSGRISLRAPSRDTQVTTVSGDIRLTGLRERLRLETVSGNADIAGEGISSVDLKSISGDLRLTGAIAHDPAISVHTLSGDIVVELPKDPDARIELRTFSGKVESAFGARATGTVRTSTANVGSGKGHIALDTFSGDIRLSRHSP